MGTTLSKSSISKLAINIISMKNTIADIMPKIAWGNSFKNLINTSFIKPPI